MAAVITGSARPTVQFGYAPANALAAGQAIPFALPLQMSLPTSGVGANQVDLLYAEPLTIPAGSSVTVDLQSFTDYAGVAGCSFARVREVAWQMQSTADGDSLAIGGAGSDPWAGLAAGGAAVKAYAGAQLGAAINGGWAIFTMPNTTGAAVSPTSRYLLISNPGAADVVLNLVIAGCHA